jgi:hypothetical protein
MINASPRNVKAYWFFTPFTIPDNNLLDLLNPERHEVALHVANNPYTELKILEKKTQRTVKYYTIHGTQQVVARLLWGRKLGQTQASIPKNFPLLSFHNYLTMSLDRERYLRGFETALKETEEWNEQGAIVSIHPEWLFAIARKTRRGPFYDVLKKMLQVDEELDTLGIRKKLFFKIAHDIHEYEKSNNPKSEFLYKLGERGIDIFTFVDRKWSSHPFSPPSTWVSEDDNVGLLEIKSYDDWWQEIGKKTRNMVRRAEKSGVKISIVNPSEELAEGIWKIYNETPIRQERAFAHYGESLQTVTENMYASKNNTFIGGYLGNELVGFIQILYGDNIAIISNILSLKKHWDKSLNNALLAKAVEVCASNGNRWLMYGRIGNHPSLDKFKENNGFFRSPLTRYYIPLTAKGRFAVKIGLHQDLKDKLPDTIKYRLIPVMNWISRTRILIKIKTRKKRG